MPRKKKRARKVSRIECDTSICEQCQVCAAICSMLAFGVSNPQLGGIKVMSNFDLGVVDVNTCRQCVALSCVEVCNLDAFARDEATGAWVIDRSKCPGCRLCEKACPVGAIVFDPGSKVCFKCDLCGGEAVCVTHCPAGALTLVDIK